MCLRKKQIQVQESVLTGQIGRNKNHVKQEGWTPTVRSEWIGVQIHAIRAVVSWLVNDQAGEKPFFEL